MSLLAARPPAPEERASVVLPTVKCSTCAVEIPLNYLGEHICGSAPAPRANNFGPSPFRHGGPNQGSRSHLNAQTGGTIKRPGAPTMLRPSGPSRFDDELVAPSRFGDYTADVPMSAVSANMKDGQWPSHEQKGMLPPRPLADDMPPPSPTLPDTRSGGNAGMAGVGRRAFAAAAWSVRAGVALAHGAGKDFAHDHGSGGMHDPSDASPNPSPMNERPPPNQMRDGRAATPRQMPVAMPMPRASPSQQSPVDYRPPVNRSASSTSSRSVREPVILPKVPLSGRAPSRNQSRNGDWRAPSRAGDHRGDEFLPARPQDIPNRSATSQSRYSPETERAHNNGPNSPFFDRYRQMVETQSDQTHDVSRSKYSPVEERSRRHHPRHSSYDAGSSIGGEESSLPWARSETEEERYDHRRYPTDGSIPSTSSSASGDHNRGGDSSSHEAEMVMTPSHSWEGLVERTANVAIHDDKLKANNSPYAFPGLNFGESIADSLHDIHDEDDGEHFVVGAPLPDRRANGHLRSSSQSTVKFDELRGAVQKKKTSPLPSPNLSRDLDPPRIPLQISNSAKRSPDLRSANVTPSPTSSRPRRQCANCGEAVGGSKRFVERDGVVLCEADWKKLYLPACRRCRQPIEKSAVSSSDGQLKGKWHRACFTCTRCDKPFTGNDFYVYDGRPWCQYHYAEEANTLCSAPECRQPIEGPCILAPAGANSKEQRYHPGHLKCKVCGDQNMFEYYEIPVEGGTTDKYCELHYKNLVSSGGAGGRGEKRRTRLVDLASFK